MIELKAPCDGPVLLHSCCAPCSGALLEAMVASGIRPLVFFSNSNIVPKDEYDLRKTELVRYCDLMDLEVVDDDYDHESWLGSVLEKGREKELAQQPERCERCLNCFRFRLMRAARFAEVNGCSVLATTLATSRWKDLDQVNSALEWACSQVDGVTAWTGNWRKGGLQPRRSEIIVEQNFYNQTFCGCEFSLRR